VSAADEQSSVPEPVTVLLFGVGAGAFARRYFRRRDRTPSV